MLSGISSVDINDMTLHYFNPDNDLALANGNPHYTPTPHAELLRRDLQLLPCWLALPGDAVLCDDPSLQAWVDEHQLPVTLVGRNRLGSLPADTVLRPWGWSAAMRWRLMRWSTPEAILPNDNDIDQWRMLSHRRTTIDIHRRVNALLGYTLCPTPIELSSLDDVLEFAHSHAGCYIKEPWSGSGRGILRAIDHSGRDFVQRAFGSLRKQGTLLCEPAYDRVLDFAIEMECQCGVAEVIGYSVFESDFHSQFSSGMVAQRKVLRQMIQEYYPEFEKVENALAQVVTEMIAPHYNGPLGIDMLLYRRNDNTIGINPCVEMNLRTTMGHVTAALGNRHGMEGRFIIKNANQIMPTDILLTPVEDGTRLAAVVTKS